MTEHVLAPEAAHHEEEELRLVTTEAVVVSIVGSPEVLPVEEAPARTAPELPEATADGFGSDSPETGPDLVEFLETSSDLTGIVVQTIVLTGTDHPAERPSDDPVIPAGATGSRSGRLARELEQRVSGRAT